MIRAVFWGILCALLALPAAAGEEMRNAGFIHEVKIGAQAHDVPYLWSGFNVERYAVDLNVEVIFPPSVAFLGGVLRPALGATINFYGDTSNSYGTAATACTATAGTLWADPNVAAAISKTDVDNGTGSSPVGVVQCV